MKIKILLCVALILGIGTFGAFAAAPEDVVSSYTFLPGEKVLRFEDFSSGQLPQSGFRFDGQTEIVTEDGVKWLKAIKANLHISLPEKIDDFTLDFYFKAKNYPGFEIYFGRPYDNRLEVGKYDGYVYYSGSCAGKPLPATFWYKKKCYNDGETVHFSMTVNQQKLKIYINRVLVLNAAGYAPVMPRDLRIYLRDNVKNSEILIKDLRLATGVPDIAGELLGKGKYTSHGVYFDTGSAKIRAESHYVLSQIAGVLASYPDLKLLIVGHTDNVGGKEMNQKLSIARANSVKDYLVNVFKIDPNRLTTDGKGDTEPVADNKTPESRAQNRRVEFIRQ